jgi:opacity protein-like surface antigen
VEDTEASVTIDETPAIVETLAEPTVAEPVEATTVLPSTSSGNGGGDTPEVATDDAPSTIDDTPEVTVDEIPSPAITVPPVIPVIPVLVTAKDTSDADDTNDAAGTPVTSKPKIAVYVTGSKDNVENRALGTYILEALVRSGNYTAIERSELFLAEIDNEQIKQRSGAIDDAQISRLGMQSGVQFVCVADVTRAFGGNQVSVRVLDVETAEVVAVGVADGPLRNMSDLRNISEKVVNAMLGIVIVQEKKVRFGARVAYNNSHVFNHTFSVQVFDRDELRFIDVDYDNEFGAGHGFELGFVTLFRLTGRLSIESGVNFLMRSPVTVTDVAEITEFAVSVPALLRYRIGTSPVYVLGGAHVDIPFGAKLKRDSEGADDFDERASVDVGLTAGIGYQILKNLSADVRVANGLLSYDGLKGHLLFQGAVGVSWMF